MGAGNTCEFKGKAAILEGYKMFTDQNDSPYWSIWASKEMRFAYMENDSAGSFDYLAQICDILQNTQAIYTIRFHPEPNSRGKIDSNTPHSGSFNFKLSDGNTYSQTTVIQPAAPSPADKLFQLIQERTMQKMLDAMEAAEKAPADQGSSVSGFGSPEEIFTTISENPLFQRIAGDVYDRVTDYFSKPKRPQPMNDYRRTGTRPGFRPQQQQQPNPEQYHGIAGVTAAQPDLQKAIERLQAVDNNLAAHLDMLASVAEDSPMIYKKAIKKLKSFMDE